ncbi:50S ribosomal protein L21e, partial [Candidatus Pacearchaeota archaeon]
MPKQKAPRQKGKFSFSRYFQKFKEGDRVAVVRDLTFPFAYPRRLQGKTGVVIGKRGKAYCLLIKDLNKEKKYCIEPIHLKRIEQ